MNTSIKPTIRAINFIHDIRSGLTDFELTEKYSLTETEFESVLHYLVAGNLMSTEELASRQILSQSQITRCFIDVVHLG